MKSRSARRRYYTPLERSDASISIAQEVFGFVKQRRDQRGTVLKLDPIVVARCCYLDVISQFSVGVF